MSRENIPRFPPTNKDEKLKSSISLHLYASFYPVLNLSGAQHSSYMQMFHLQTMNLISHYHCSLMAEEKRRVGGQMEAGRAKISITNGSMHTEYLSTKRNVYFIW